MYAAANRRHTCTISEAMSQLALLLGDTLAGPRIFVRFLLWHFPLNSSTVGNLIRTSSGESEDLACKPCEFLRLPLSGTALNGTP